MFFLLPQVGRDIFFANTSIAGPIMLYHWTRAGTCLKSPLAISLAGFFVFGALANLQQTKRSPCSASVQIASE